MCFVQDGSHTVRLPQEPPCPSPGPTSCLHAVPPDSARTFGSHLLPRLGFFILLLFHFIPIALHYLQLPYRRRPVLRTAPPSSPPQPPPVLTAASPSTSAPPRALAYLTDAITSRQQRTPQSVPPALPLLSAGQRAHTTGPGPHRSAQSVCQHPQSGGQQHPDRGLLCVCRLW